MDTPILVSTDWLEAHLDDANLRIVDIRGHVFSPLDPEAQSLSHYPDYLDSHIPGAVFVDWIEHICDDPQHLRVADRHKFAKTMNDIGVDESTFVVAYDDTNGRLAARLWWALHYYGHERVAVLDGGWLKWRAENRATTTDVPRVERTAFEPVPDETWIQEGGEILHELGGTMQLMDMRLPDEYNGDLTFTRQAGHIPGAVNVPVNELVTEAGTLHSPDELQQRFAQAGVNGAKPDVVAYSNVGVDASFGVFALHVAGFNTGRVYDASWQEWGNDESKPVE